jgi:hypothetical protein
VIFVEEQEMAEFPEDVVKKAFGAADGRCECLLVEHGHKYNSMCMRVLDWNKRGQSFMGPDGQKGWEANWIVPPEKGGKPTQQNCEILCWDCYCKKNKK